MTTVTFLGDPKFKLDLLAELARHRKMDQFIRGYYQNEEHGDDFKGCSLGCSIHSLRHLRDVEIDYDDHAGFAESIGVPEWLVRLQDATFEGMPPADAPVWTEHLISAIPEGVTPETLRCRVLAPFMVFALADCRGRADRWGKAAIDTVAALWSRVEAGDEPTDGEWSAAIAGASAAAEPETRHETWRAEWCAAWAATWGVEDAAWRSATWSATHAAAWSRYADELVRLLEACE